MKRTINRQKETLSIIRKNFKGPVLLATDGVIINW
jgi:hypothetical protein